MCGGEFGLFSGCVGESTVCGGEFNWGCDAGGKGASCGGEASQGSGGIGGALFKAGRSVFVESRLTERGGGDGRSEGDTEKANAWNLLRAAKRQYGRDGAVPAKIMV